MKAMILAAGLGTRLRPLTLERAKPAIPVIDKPLIVRLISRLIEDNFTGFRLNLHHLPSTIETIFRNPIWGDLPVSFSYESQILGTAGGLKANESFFDDGVFLMVNGDIVLEFPLKEALLYHQENKALATLILYPQSAPFTYYPVKIDEAGLLRNFKKACPSENVRPETYVFTGAQILEPRIFGLIPSGVRSEIADEIYPMALNLGEKILGFPVEGYWSDLGNPKRYLDTQKELLTRVGTSSLVHIADTAIVSPEAAVGPYTSIGHGCKVEPGVIIENSILWENVRVRSNYSIRNSIIGSELIIDRDCANIVLTRNGEARIF